MIVVISLVTRLAFQRLLAAASVDIRTCDAVKYGTGGAEAPVRSTWTVGAPIGKATSK
jgi:hypothetical protein